MSFGALTPIPRYRATDAAGDPISGALLYTYEAQSASTPLATYSDYTLLSANANPVVADSNGLFGPIYLQAQSYKMILKTSTGVTVWSQDNVYDFGEVQLGTRLPPPGMMAPYGASSAPSGWLLCDGSAVSRTTYAALFAVISTAYGIGDGVTTFNVPNFAGRFPLGVAASGTGNTLGATGGLIDHVHTGPSHTHTGPSHTHTYTDVVNHTHPIPDPGHQHNGYNLGADAGFRSPAGDWTFSDGSGNEPKVTKIASTGITATSNPSGGVASGTTAASGTGATGASGTGNTGTANPPFLTAYYIIKT